MAQALVSPTGRVQLGSDACLAGETGYGGTADLWSRKASLRQEAEEKLVDAGAGSVCEWRHSTKRSL